MNKSESRIVFVQKDSLGEYNKQIVNDPQEKLLLLGIFFDSCVGFEPSIFPIIEKEIIDGMVGCNDIGAQRINGKFEFQHIFLEDVKSTKLDQEELLQLVKDWFVLIENKTKKIILSWSHGKYSISGG